MIQARKLRLFTIASRDQKPMMHTSQGPCSGQMSHEED